LCTLPFSKHWVELFAGAFKEGLYVREGRGEGEGERERGRGREGEGERDREREKKVRRRGRDSGTMENR
jgi:hypothetical protein